MFFFFFLVNSILVILLFRLSCLHRAVNPLWFCGLLFNSFWHIYAYIQNWRIVLFLFSRWKGFFLHNGKHYSLIRLQWLSIALQVVWFFWAHMCIFTSRQRTKQLILARQIFLATSLINVFGLSDGLHYCHWHLFGTHVERQQAPNDNSTPRISSIPLVSFRTHDATAHSWEDKLSNCFGPQNGETAYQKGRNSYSSLIVDAL